MRRSFCRAGFDRIQWLAEPLGRSRLPEFPGAHRVRGCLVRSQTNVKTYARAAEYQVPATMVRIFLQYQPQLPALPQFKLTLVPHDQHRLAFEEIERIAGGCGRCRPSLVEVPLDFSPESGIDLAFVRMHTIFGKCRPKGSRLYGRTALYGSRKGDKLIRCYWKQQVQSFRIELELHSRWLRLHGITKVEDLRKLPRLVYPKHIRFVRVNWPALEKHLTRRHLAARTIIRRAKVEFDSIHKVLDFIRKIAGVKNAHRFLVSLAVNRHVRRALKKWSRDF